MEVIYIGSKTKRCPSTLRRWETEGRLVPEHCSLGHSAMTWHSCWASKAELSLQLLIRVSSHDQKADLERQKQAFVSLVILSFSWLKDLELCGVTKDLLNGAGVV